MKPQGRRRGAPLWLRILRVTVLTVAIAVVGWRFLPRLLVKSVGDRAYLREEFLYPAVYESGGFTVGGFTVGERAVDCSRMERPRAATDRNLLAGEALDDPCGWTFVPHLGGKVRRDREATGGKAFCLGDEGERILQIVDLSPLTGFIQRGDIRFTFSGRVKGKPAILACEQLSDPDPWPPDAKSDGTRLHGGEMGWRHVTAAGEISRGTRALRVVLRRGAGGGGLFGPDACFDDLSLVVSRR